MIFYILFDLTGSIIYWLIKNLGYGVYTGISYLYYGNTLTKEEEENKKTLEILIQQKEDIDKIKEFIEKIQNDRNNKKLKNE